MIRIDTQQQIMLKMHRNARHRTNLLSVRWIFINLFIHHGKTHTANVAILPIMFRTGCAGVLIVDYSRVARHNAQQYEELGYATELRSRRALVQP